jgi:hypothetical protein
MANSISTRFIWINLPIQIYIHPRLHVYVSADVYKSVYMCMILCAYVYISEDTDVYTYAPTY